MRNVTITLEAEVARWARIRAAELDTSVSRLLGDLLRDLMQREQTYESARLQYMGHEPGVLNEPGATYPTRHELHDRSDLR